MPPIRGSEKLLQTLMNYSPYYPGILLSQLCRGLIKELLGI